jgi:hypothetical protein
MGASQCGSIISHATSAVSIDIPMFVLLLELAVFILYNLLLLHRLDIPITVFVGLFSG